MSRQDAMRDAGAAAVQPRLRVAAVDRLRLVLDDRALCGRAIEDAAAYEIERRAAAVGRRAARALHAVRRGGGGQTPSGAAPRGGTVRRGERDQMSGRVGARALARRVGIGQRWSRRSDGAVVVVYEVHRGDRTVEAHLGADDPHAAGTRSQLAFRELASGYRLLDHRGRGAAA